MRVGAIDIGTNSVHLLVAEVSPDGRISVVEHAREQVELGAGEFKAHRLTPEAFSRGIEALRTFRHACDSLLVEDIHATATSAVREAENGAEFCLAVKEQAGIHVRVISGLDEARLVYLGARADIDFSGGRALLFDLGGGSTEFVLCDHEQALIMESLPLGHIRLADAFGPGDTMTEDQRRALKNHVQKLLQPLLSRVRGSDFHTLIGTSGTARTLARIATLRRGDTIPEHEHGLVLHRAELDDLIRTFKTRPPSTWGQIPGMDDKRKRTLPVGAIFVRELMKALNKDHLLTSERSLRDGLIVDWIIRHRPELDISRSVADPRRRSVLATMARYGVDDGHARATAEFALQIFDATATIHGLSVDDRRLLEFGAMLHDVGHHIDGEEHHRHGQYLIRHTRMPGFTAPEIAVLGNIIRYHRGSKPKLRHAEFAALSARDQQRVRVMSAMVRLADGLDRGHHHNVVQLEVVREPDALKVRAWTREPADLERWAAVQRTGALSEVLGLPVVVEVERHEAA